MAFLNIGFRPVKSPLLASKFTFLRKFVELITAKTPIYIIRNDHKCGIFSTLKLRLHNFLPIRCSSMSNNFQNGPILVLVPKRQQL